jgi:hypothetical protein
MKVRRPLVALVAACLVGGLSATVPAAASAASSDDAVATAAQDKRVTARQVNRKLNSTRKTLRSTRRRVNAARRSIRRLNATLATLGRRLGGTEGGLAGLLGAAPQLISSLQQLGTAVRDQIAPGLKALSDAVQGQIAPGLKRLGDFVAAPEYGFAQLVVASAGPTLNPQLGSFVVTPDIPDTVQQAQTTQQFVAQHTGALVVLYGVRSGETDGAGTVAAAHCKVTLTNEGQTTQTTPANAALGGLPFQPVDERSALTSTDEANKGFPFGLKQSGADADKPETFQSTVTVSAGDTYTVGLACVDTTPDANDPKA